MASPRGAALLALLLAPSLSMSVFGEEPQRKVRPEQLGVMLQLENMLEKCPGGIFGERAGEVDRQFAMLADAGVRWSRVGIPWEQLERKQGQIDWGPADRVVRAAGKHHVELLWMVGNTAPWDSSNGEWNGVPKDLRNPDGHFARFVRQLVERYRGQIHHWEVRNEPNLDYMFQGGKPEQYVEYLRVASRAIKRVDPKALVVFGGLGGGPVQQFNWFRKAVAALRTGGEKLPFDIANFHTYAGECDRRPQDGKVSVGGYLDWCNRQIDKTMTELELAEMPVWITEFDSPANAEAQPDPEFRGAKGQARAVREMFTRMVEDHPERKVFWAALLDDHDTGFTSMGLVASNARYEIGQPRPALAALKELLQELSRP